MPEMGAPTQPTASPNQGAAPQQQQQPDPSAIAGKAIESIQQGFQALGKLLQGAGGSGDDMKLFQQAVSATDTFIQSVTGGGDDEPDEDDKPAGKGPMPANANSKAKQATY